MKTANKILQSPVMYSVIGILLCIFFESIRSSWTGLIVLGLLICLYGFTNNKNKKGLDRYELGDNCYFIGFIYTLSIITATLVFDAEELIRGESSGIKLLVTIGIALGTSALGMFLRFLFTEDVKISKDEFEQAVSRTAWAASQLEASVAGLEKTITDKHLGKGIEAIRTSLEDTSRTITAYSARMENEIGNIGLALDQIAKDITTELSRGIADTLQKNRFDDAREALDAAVKTHAEAVTGVSTKLTNSLDQLNHAAQESITVTDGIRSALASLQDVTTSGTVGEMSKSVKHFTYEIKTLGDKLREFTEQQSKAAAQAKQNLARIENTHAAFGNLIDEIKSDVTVVSEIKKEYQREFEKASKEAIKETHQLYGKLISGAVVALAELDNLGGLARSLEIIAKKFERDEEKS